MRKYGRPTATIFTFCNKYQLFIESKNGSQHTVIFCLKYAASLFIRQLISLFSAAYFMRIVDCFGQAGFSLAASSAAIFARDVPVCSRCSALRSVMSY